MTQDPTELAPQQGQELETPAAPPTTPPAATETQPVQPPKLNLDDLDEFRQWKSAMDKQVSAVTRKAQAAEQRAQEYEAQLAQLKLQDADPTEVAAYYQAELARTKAESASREKREAEAREMNDRALDLLRELGLDYNTPGLDWSGGATSEGLALLAHSAARLVAQRSAQATQAVAQQTEEAARAAKQQALNAAGVTQVSTATGAPQHRDLEAQYQADLKALKAKGGDVAWGLVQLRNKYRQLGYEPLKTIQ